MSKREVKNYDAEFKERAVKLAIESGSHTQVAENLGINSRTLYGWIKAYHRGSAVQAAKRPKGKPLERAATEDTLGYVSQVN